MLRQSECFGAVAYGVVRMRREQARQIVYQLVRLRVSRRAVTKNRQGDRKVDATTMRDWVLLGLAQGITPLPGISRSGMTVSALLIRKVDAEEALRLSFLMAIPVTIAVVAYEVVSGNVAAFGWPAIVSGVAGSFALGYLTIEALMTTSRTVRWDLFCIVFGVLAVVAGFALLAF